MRVSLARVFILLLLLSAGCREIPVAENVNQYQAHQILNKLSANGIRARYDASTTGKSYTVNVDQRNYLPAISIIARSGIVPKTDSDFQELTEPKGFLSNNKNFDVLRLDRALAVELEDALLSMPNVAAAKAVVRNYSLKEGQLPSVSLVLTLSTRDQAIDSEISSLIKNMIPGIVDQNIQVLHQNRPGVVNDLQMTGVAVDAGKQVLLPLVPFLIWNVPSGVDQDLAIYAILLILFSLFTGYLLGFFIRRPKRNQSSGLSLPDSASLALGLERKLNDDFK